MTAVMNQTFQCTQVRLITFLSIQFSTGCSESTGRKTIESHLCAVRSSDRVYFLVCAFSKSPLVSSEMALFCFFSGPPHQSQNTIEANMNEIKLIPTQQIQVRFRFSLTWQLQVRTGSNIFKLFVHPTIEEADVQGVQT